LQVIRTQIQLEEQQARRLKQLAQAEGISIAAVIRRCVDRGLLELQESLPARYHRARVALGSCQAPGSDAAEEHDQYLDDDFG
jgi:hypothetical protein